MPTETILRLLENGKWHYLKDIEKKTRLDSSKVENVTKFLAKYNFVKLDEAKQKVKLDPPTNRFLKRLRQLENEENFQQMV
jgi:DNA-binding IclR family transcriptional regulator